MSLVELMVASGLGSLVLACVASLSIYGARTSVAVLNYTDLDGKSRYAADWISEEMRQATGVSGFGTNSTGKWLALTNRNTGVSFTITQDTSARTLWVQKTGLASFVALPECDQWNYSFYQRSPIITSTNVQFFPATNTAGQMDLSTCKLISMSWKCSRTILAKKVNTESVQAAQIVLRNKM